MSEKKKCTACGDEKEVLLFRREGNRIRNQCKECEKIRKSSRHKTYSRKLHTRYITAIRKAKSRQIEFSISFEEYSEIVSQSCFYCDGLFGLTNETGSGLDRLDSSKNYTIDNVVSCCTLCNRIKNEYLSPEETKVAVLAILKLRNK